MNVLELVDFSLGTRPDFVVVCSHGRLLGSGSTPEEAVEDARKNYGPDAKPALELLATVYQLRSQETQDWTILSSNSSGVSISRTEYYAPYITRSGR